MSFKQQVARARANYLNTKWKYAGRSTGDLINSGNENDMSTLVSTPGFKKLAADAYAAKGGYAIRTNPVTGEKEMFVRGTTFKRGGIEWLQNVVESPVGRVPGGLSLARSASLLARRKRSEKLSEIARRAGVKTIYGHSRGAALVNDMNVPGANKLGLDGALLLARKPAITNYRQRQAFDALIGYGAKKTVKKSGYVAPWRKNYHRVYYG